ncbi:MAG: hypothetical protein ACK4N5_09375, partial [Myxococcales bacterium]
IGAGAAVALFGVGLVVASSGGNSGEVYGNVQNVAEAPPPQVDPLKLLGQCKTYADKDNELNNWAKAEEVCGKAVDLDPTLTEARALQRLAKREINNKRFYEEARLKISASQDELGMELLGQIEKDSAYFIRARKEFNEAAERVEKRKFSACMTSMKQDMYVQAYEECKRSAEMVCNTERGISEKLQDVIKKLAQRTGKPANITCPEEYKKFQAATKVALAGVDPVKEIRKKYPEKELQEVFLTYFEDGRPKQASDKLKRMRAKQRKKFGTSLDDYILLLDLIDGRYTSGQAFVITQDPDRVMSYWKDAFESDAKLMPEGVVSALSKDMATQLSTIYVKKADEEISKQRETNAFRYLYEGYKIDKTNTLLNTRLQQMEGVARQNLDGGCQEVKKALDLTMPDTSLHKKAEERLKELGC